MHTWMGNLMHNQVSNRPDAYEPVRRAGPVLGPGRRRPVRHRGPVYVNGMTYRATTRSTGTARRTSCDGTPAAGGGHWRGETHAGVRGVRCPSSPGRIGPAAVLLRCLPCAYRDRQTSGRIIGVGLLTAEAEIAGDIEALARLLCPECGQPVLPGGRRRRDAAYCSGTCRTRAWRHRRLPLEDREERPVAVTSTRHQKAGHGVP
ncbi:hypothetical protein ACH4EC_39160 [Streptomyces anulatus]